VTCLRYQGLKASASLGLRGHVASVTALDKLAG